jgi:hypothetical protein
LNLGYTNVEGDFAALAGSPMRDVRLEGCRRAGDQCARTLAEFPSLRQLEIHMTALTDEGLRYLAHSRLEVIWPGGGGITDGGTTAVATMTALKLLNVCAPGVTDQGERAISGLTGLEVLWLSRCRITDASVDLLAGFRHLRELSVDKTGVTPAGKARLRMSLLECHLVENDIGSAGRA